MKLVNAFGLVLSLLAVSAAAAERFDFFYFVQQVNIARRFCFFLFFAMMKRMCFSILLAKA
jgi:hypothetical protein